MDSTPQLEGFQSMGAGAAFKKEVCEMISSTQLFGDFEWGHIEDLSWYVQAYRLEPGVVVFKEGDPGTYMCLLIEGQVEIVKKDQDGDSHQLVLVSKGKTVGEMSIIDDEMRSATCVTTKESVLLLLTEENYFRIIKERPLLAVKILSKLAKLMSQRLRGLSGQMVERLDEDGE